MQVFCGYVRPAERVVTFLKVPPYPTQGLVVLVLRAAGPSAAQKTPLSG
jgi:hypothetical protein